MAKQKRKTYNVRWYGATDATTRANVDITATSDHHAKIQADKVGRELNVTNCRRTITEGGRTVE